MLSRILFLCMFNCIIKIVSFLVMIFRLHIFLQNFFSHLSRIIGIQFYSPSPHLELWASWILSSILYLKVYQLWYSWKLGVQSKYFGRSLCLDHFLIRASSQPISSFTPTEVMTLGSNVIFTKGSLCSCTTKASNSTHLGYDG